MALAADKGGIQFQTHVKVLQYVQRVLRLTV